jgi:hypothetical protein
VLNFIVLAVALVAAAARLDAMAPAAAVLSQGPPVNADAHTMAEFSKRIAEYAALHKKIESALPKLPVKATPTEIDTNQRAFATQLGGRYMPLPSGLSYSYRAPVPLMTCATPVWTSVTAELNRSAVPRRKGCVRMDSLMFAANAN